VPIQEDEIEIDYEFPEGIGDDSFLDDPKFVAALTRLPQEEQQFWLENLLQDFGRLGAAKQLASRKGPVKKAPQAVDERQIKIWKQELRGLRGTERRTRYEMGKRLAAIQAERAKAHVGTFTKVDLKELKIGIPLAYRLIKFFKKIDAKAEAYLLQFAKDQERFPIEDVEDYDKRVADAKNDALNQVIDAEAARISALRNTADAQPTDYRLLVECGTSALRERLKVKWLSLDEKIRSAVVYRAVMNEPFPNSVLPAVPLPFTYTPDFLTKDETDELTAYFETQTFHVRVNPRNPKNPKYNIKRQSLGYIASNAFNDRDQKEWGTEYADIDTAPELLQRFRAKLSAHVGKDVNYMSILKYPDGNAHIDWHQHGEDRWHDSPVWDVSVGPTERMFWAREIDNPKTTKIGVLAEVGSLITLPSSMNTTHQHAILKDETTGVRYSINCKSLPLTGVWDCHAGKRYPADAEYVGCRVVDRKGNVIRKGTIFGNGADPFVSREGGYTTEAEFREYAEQKMQDPEFRAKVDGLRGKHLLCWCVQTGPKREKFCHARVWLEIANRDPHATNPS
jgi:hypothetical protein